MPRPSKPVRLQLDPGRVDRKSGVRRPGYWLIRDGEKRVRTGCREENYAGAEAALATHLARRHAEAEPEPNLAASQVLISDVISYYARECVEGDEPVADPKELLFRSDRLLAWWGRRNLNAVNGYTCKAYAKHIGSPAAARRDLEDFRAAINLHHRDGLCRDVVKVVLPPKSKRRITYFSRDEVAKLLWYCWRAKEVQKGVVTNKRHLRHLVPFILVALYTGSRSGKIWRAGFVSSSEHSWIDLENAVFHRLGSDEDEHENKRAGSVRIPDRLMAHLRRHRLGPLVDGARKPRKWVVEYRGGPADPRGALSKAMDHVYGSKHRFVTHTYRHTAASWLIWAGEDLNEIAAYLSMTVETLIKTYGHDHPEANMSIGRAFTEGRAGYRKGRSRRERASDKAA